MALLLFLNAQQSYAQSDSIYIWPKTVPGQSNPKKPPVPTRLKDGTIRVIEVSNPFLAVFEPVKKNGKAIVICPGGGYRWLAVHKEGYTIANWLSRLGYTAFVLQYRVPEKRDGALHDLQRAIRIVKGSAQRFGIDSANVYAMGFSAGAHLIARAGMAEPMPTYPAQDDLDRLSCKPDQMIAIYPAYLDSGPDGSLPPELKATAKTVNTFIFQTTDDSYFLSSLALARALRSANAEVELHMLPEGGHGYGMDPGNTAAEAWPKLLETWLAKHH